MTISGEDVWMVDTLTEWAFLNGAGEVEIRSK